MNFSLFEQFELKLLSKLTILGLDLSITNLISFLFLAHAILIFFFTAVAREKSYLPSNWQRLVESIYLFIVELVKEQSGKKGIKFFPFFFTIFCLIFEKKLIETIISRLKVNRKVINSDYSCCFIIPFTPIEIPVSENTLLGLKLTFFFSLFFFICNLLVKKNIIRGYGLFLIGCTSLVILLEKQFQIITEGKVLYLIISVFLILVIACPFFFSASTKLSKAKTAIKNFECYLYGRFFEEHSLLGEINYYRLLIISLLAYPFERKPGFRELLRILLFSFILGIFFNYFFILVNSLLAIVTLHSTRRKYQENIFFNSYVHKNSRQFNARIVRATELFGLEKENSLFLRSISEKASESFIKAMENPGKVAATFGLILGTGTLDSYNRHQIYQTKMRKYEEAVSEFKRNPNSFSDYPKMSDYFTPGDYGTKTGDGLGYQMSKTMETYRIWKQNGGKGPVDYISDFFK